MASYNEKALAAPRIDFAAAILFGGWYSIILASAMCTGVKYLHPETPLSHGIQQSFAWALGSGAAITLASSLSSRHRFAVGVLSTLISMSVWIAVLFLLSGDLDQLTGDSLLGHPLSVGNYLVAVSLLVLLVGMVGSYFGAQLRGDEELIAELLLVPSRHWSWLWIAGGAWVSTLPLAAYYLWLQLSLTFYTLIHPSLWFDFGSMLGLGMLGIAALAIGIQVSLKAVSSRSAFGGVVWKRVSMFLLGSLVLASLLAPILLNLDIAKMKGIPASLGAHPWWIL